MTRPPDAAPTRALDHNAELGSRGASRAATKPDATPHQPTLAGPPDLPFPIPKKHNLSPVDVGRIELLVGQGFYANRAEFIRVAIHDKLASHNDVVREASTRRAMVLGALICDRARLEAARSAGERLDLRVVGLLDIRPDVSPELARATIGTIAVHGVFRASDAVKEALSDRVE